MVKDQNIFLPGDIVQVLEGDYAWAHKIVGKRAMVVAQVVPLDPIPGEILIEGESYSVYCTEVARITDG
jgi:hypothetical protein